MLGLLGIRRLFLLQGPLLFLSSLTFLCVFKTFDFWKIGLIVVYIHVDPSSPPRLSNLLRCHPTTILLSFLVHSLDLSSDSSSTALPSAEGSLFNVLAETFYFYAQNLLIVMTRRHSPRAATLILRA